MGAIAAEAHLRTPVSGDCRVLGHEVGCRQGDTVSCLARGFLTIPLHIYLDPAAFEGQLYELWKSVVVQVEIRIAEIFREPAGQVLECSSLMDTTRREYEDVSETLIEQSLLVLAFEHKISVPTKLTHLPGKFFLLFYAAILRSRTDRRRMTEVAIAVHALNRMLELGRPKSVRTA
jgi:hypothetical protein